MTRPEKKVPTMSHVTAVVAQERGSAMILVLGAVVVLTALAMIVVSVTSSDKWASFAEHTHSRAFYSADAASEGGMNWLRNRPNPPPIIGASNSVRNAGAYVNMGDGHSYRYGIKYVTKQFRPGWPVEYKDYVFTVEADGTSSKGAEAAVDLAATRLYREGY